MHKKSILLFLGIILASLVYGQEKDPVLLMINNSPVYTSEFKRVYLKNIDLVKDESQKDIDEYLELFINYKLKLEEAKEQGLDKKETYIKELEGYKKQLSAGYLTDSKASEALVKEAYDRLQQRVNASHILILVKPNASPKDTLTAYQKITEARNKIVKGGDFKEIALQYSEDPSAKKNGGDLGWFSAFRMVYPFEDAAFTTKIGEVSEPFKTRFGYHIVKVNDKQKTLGEVTVAHIMVAFNKDRTEEQAKERIKEINIQLTQDASFETLAKEYSDDRNTAVNGGKINKFAQGALNSEDFEKVAFALQTAGDLSQPVKTKYGWHIIKLLEKHPPKTFNELEGELTRRIKKDSRSQLITESFINSLKQKYSLNKNEEAITYFKKVVPTSIFKEKWDVQLDEESLEKPLFSIGKNSYLYKDFAKYVQDRGVPKTNNKDVSEYIESIYEAYESSQLLQYYEEHLEEDNQDYANVISEYRDGLLLFDLMEDKIWNAAKVDSVGLKKFYESRKDSYIQGKTYKVLKASSSVKESIAMVKKLLEKGKSIQEIKKEINTKDSDAVIFAEEELIHGEDAITSTFTGKNEQLIETNDDNYFTVIKVVNIVPSRIKTFEEIKGKVINDFQEDLENKWLGELRKKYSVELNKKTLKKIKKELAI
ncbi:peptidylprolyl isomerase [Aquimarina sp. 2201CG14-23]|uniref:peptidylprolyl isomerase n=1 Tax=Aquimarina mycalae TaxID=3040073 RepID=UPI002477E936|nr:peptidylprolyl isomerase [Aquimarina sp. 2201CG14-23]MDH7444334.1 peptidylprolyl isomerase [Aquimarina sp. 2201CG14-23]